MRFQQFSDNSVMYLSISVVRETTKQTNNKIIRKEKINNKYIYIYVYIYIYIDIKSVAIFGSSHLGV